MFRFILINGHKAKVEVCIIITENLSLEKNQKMKQTFFDNSNTVV